MFYQVMYLFPQLSPEPLKMDPSVKTGADVVRIMKANAIAIAVNDHVQDLSLPLPSEGSIRFISLTDPEGLEILRHSTAHILAHAVKELFPDTQVTIGPVIENGFYYDFFRSEPFREEDLRSIETRMRDIVKRNEPVHREVWDRDQAITFFENQGEAFKVQIIKDIPSDQKLSFYQQGNFVDLCRGPHLPSTGSGGDHFRLMKISGAYWRGDAKNPQLQRIYGTAWATEEELSAYLHMLEEAEKRDHRRLGHDMELFHFQEEAPGSVFWHPKGWSIYTTLQGYIRRTLQHRGYQEVNTPQLVDKSLWEASGHWDKFRENMFLIPQEEKTFGLKPMNCPCHVQIFNRKLRSYKDLPLRLAEFGSCMRNESSGSRAGLMRVSSFVQDDAHIFCTPEQITSETKTFCALLFEVYHAMGFDNIIVRLSTRPEKRLGTDEVWDHAEEALALGAKSAGLEYTLFPGEGAFYGPKLEFVLKDSLGRLWQCGTLQVDFVLPQRLEAYYVGADGHKHHPVMLHRAILGSMERFIGVLLEHTGGILPLWLAPTQVSILSVSEKTSEYAQEVANHLEFLRVDVDTRNEKIGYKIREHTLKKVPILVIIGAKEQENQTVTLRFRENQDAQEIVALSKLPDMLRNLVAQGAPKI
jgi:threonyl-tRNA synthetase